MRPLRKPCILFSGRGQINEEPACLPELVERREACPPKLDVSGVALKAKPGERRGKCTKTVHEDSDELGISLRRAFERQVAYRATCQAKLNERSLKPDVSGVAQRAEPECVFDTPSGQKTRFPKWSIFSLRAVCLGFIWLYQYVLSSSFKFLLGGTCHACRFYPTCSEYAREAFLAYPPLSALWYTLLRLAKCHPFHQGGLDLLPKKNLD